MTPPFSPAFFGWLKRRYPFGSIVFLCVNDYAWFWSAASSVTKSIRIMDSYIISIYIYPLDTYIYYTSYIIIYGGSTSFVLPGTPRSASLCPGVIEVRQDTGSVSMSERGELEDSNSRIKGNPHVYVEYTYTIWIYIYIYLFTFIRIIPQPGIRNIYF